MAEEEDEVAVGMEKGFMDEFFEQVGPLNTPDSSLLLSVFDLPFHLRQADGIYSSQTEGQNLSLYLILPGLFFTFQSFHRSCPAWRVLIRFIDDAVGVFKVQPPSLTE